MNGDFDTEGWQEIARLRIQELASDQNRLWMQPWSDASARELPYRLTELMRGTLVGFEMAFHAGLEKTEALPRLEESYGLWRRSAADLFATLETLPVEKDCLAKCRSVFAGGQEVSSLSATVETMEKLASAQGEVGGSLKAVSRDHLKILEVLAGSSLVDDDAAQRRLTKRACADLGAGFALKQLSPDVYGLSYPGFWGTPSWCYLTVGDGAVIATQPDGDCGTSITNIWNPGFIANLKGFLVENHVLRDGDVRTFEHDYRYGAVNAVELTAEGSVRWLPVASREEGVRGFFERITGNAMPDFGAFGFGHEARGYPRDVEAPDALEQTRSQAIDNGLASRKTLRLSQSAIAPSGTTDGSITFGLGG